MEFELNKAIEILQGTPLVIASLLGNLSEDWYSNNEGGETWRPYDVVGHLVHGEQRDWIQKMNIILSNNGNKTFEPFDRFAQFKESKGKSLHEIIDEFGALRKKNLIFLTSLRLTDTDLLKTGIHPSFGEVTLKQLLATWVVHDMTHISQIVRVMAKQYTTEVGPWEAYLSVLKK